MENYCNVTLSVSGSPEELKSFVCSNMKLKTGISGAKQVFRLEALCPLGPNMSCYNHWGCDSDICDAITLEHMGWHEDCDSIFSDFQVVNAPPLRWFYTVVARFPQLTFDIFAGCYLLDFQISAHAANGEILQEEITNYDDSDSPVEYENPDYLAEMLTDFPLSEALLSGVESFANSVDGQSDENWFFWDSPNPEDTGQSGEEFEEFFPKIDANQAEVDRHGFTDTPAGVFRYRDGTICILDNYRAEHNLLLITLSMQAELFWAGFKLKAWGRLKLADYLDGNTIAEK